MKKSFSLKSNQDGIIHHLGLILIAVVFVGALGFATTRIIASQASSNKEVSVTEDEDESENTKTTVEQDSSDEEGESSNDL